MASAARCRSASESSLPTKSLSKASNSASGKTVLRVMRKPLTGKLTLSGAAMAGRCPSSKTGAAGLGGGADGTRSRSKSRSMRPASGRTCANAASGGMNGHARETARASIRRAPYLQAKGRACGPSMRVAGRGDSRDDVA
jgi:hypothetical protein